MGPVSGTPTLFQGCLSEKNMCCITLQSVYTCFRASSNKKTSPPQNGQKCQFLAQISFFLGLGVQSVPPLPLFQFPGLNKILCCMPLKSCNTCFRAVITQRTSFFATEMAKKSHFLAQISAFLVWGVSLCPSYPILRVLDSEHYLWYPPEVI